jgi:hypothetical protein
MRLIDTKRLAHPPHMPELNFGLPIEYHGKVYHHRGGIMDFSMGEKHRHLEQGYPAGKSTVKNLPQPLDGFMNFLLKVSGSRHALCVEFPILWPLNFFCVFGFTVLFHLLVAFDICSFGLLGYSFKGLLSVSNLDTFICGFGSLVLLGIGHLGLNNSWTLGAWWYHLVGRAVGFL